MPKPDVRTDPRFTVNRWKPGQSGNPKGRPPHRSIPTLVERVLDEKLEGKSDTKRMAVVRKFVTLLLEGNEQMLRSFFDREWPKVDYHDVSGDLTLSSPEDVDALETRLDRLAAGGSAEEPAGEPAKERISGPH